MGNVFLGSEAIARGQLTEHELRRWYRPIFRDVYVPKDSAPSLRARTTGAWLRTRQRGVIAGVAASALHGASWVDDDQVIEMIATTVRPHHGIVVRNETLADDEITWVCKLQVTTRVRTAFDLGRHLSRARPSRDSTPSCVPRSSRSKTCCFSPSATRARAD